MNRKLKRKLKLLFRRVLQTLDNITLLDAFEKILFFFAVAAFWGIIVGVFMLINSPNPRREWLLIFSCAGIIGIFVGYHRQKEKERSEFVKKEIKK